MLLLFVGTVSSNALNGGVIWLKCFTFSLSIPGPVDSGANLGRILLNGFAFSPKTSFSNANDVAAVVKLMRDHVEQTGIDGLN